MQVFKFLIFIILLFNNYLILAEDNLKWNKFNSNNNVTIYSIDYKKGYFLDNNFKEVKKFTLNRWGIIDFNISKKMVIYCAGSKEEMKKLFNISYSYSEVKEKEILMWLILDNNPKEEFPAALFPVLIKELELINSKKYKWIFHRGLSVLSSTSEQIKNNIKKYKGKNLDLKDLLSLTESQWYNLSEDDKYSFDIQSTIFCLLLAKEYSNKCLISFINTECSEKNIVEIIKFKNLNDLNLVYKKYFNNLIEDVKNDKTPNNYLIVKVGL